MKAKEYMFTENEITLLRNAMADYAHHLTPRSNDGEQRKANYKLANALKNQFSDDLRKMP